MGMAVLASDVPVYQGSLADGTAGQLVTNDPSRLVRGAGLAGSRPDLRRRSMAAQAREAFLASATLASEPDARRASLDQAVGGP